MSENRQGKSQQHPRGPRHVAEWVSFTLSALLLLSLAGYLVQQGMNENVVAVPVETRVRIDQVQQVGARFIVPVEIHNRGRRTMSDAKIQVTHTPSGGGERQVQDATIDYLGEGSVEQIYVYFDSDPNGQDVRATVLHYRLE